MERLNIAFAEEYLGKGEITQKLASMGVPAIELDNEPCDIGELPIGASRVGGEPDLPAGTSWPAHNGKPMAFVAQIDLAEVTEHTDELPKQGWLVFFMDIDAPAATVLHVEGELERCPAPVAVDDAIEPCSLEMDLTYLIPGPSDPNVVALLDDDALADLQQAATDSRVEYLPLHLLGVPMVYGQERTLPEGDRLLFQLTTDECEYPDGNLFFRIPIVDLQAQRFERVSLRVAPD